MTTTVWLLIASIILPLTYFAWSLISVDRASGRLIQSRLTAASAPKAARFPCRTTLGWTFWAAN